MMQALHVGSHLIPHPEDGPVKEGMPLELFKGKPYIMGVTAEFVAQHYGITREEMDEVALRSHNNVERATKEGDFKEEIVPIEIPQKKGKPALIFDKDEHFRPGLTMEQLAALPPAFIPKTGKVTAGNSSGINDGASAMVIMSSAKAKDLGLKPIAKIRGTGKGACHPSVMGLSPVPAMKDLFKRNPDLKLDDFEIIELNEAFAAQYIGVERELKLKREITNVNGSGIGLGHPVGSTGCRIMVTLLYAMKKRGKTLGLATICGGGGIGMATALEML
jgi:acetyl-CoA C-acetyltransferase